MNMDLQLNILPKQHYSRYVFGSSLYCDFPSDIDVAIIYDGQFVSVEDAINYRKELKSTLSDLNKSKIDVILLSKEEEMEMHFLSNAKHFEF